MKIHLVYAGECDDQRLQSPYGITRNLYKYLKERAEVEYHKWDSTMMPEINPEDIVIGHPHYDENTVIQRIFKEDVACKAKCLIHPLHTARVEDNMPFDSMARKADKIFSICGPYWYDTIESTPFKHWKPKITRLDMAVNTIHYPYLRKQFNKPGLRKLVYIGSSTPHKNLGFMVEIMKRISGTKLYWYGGSSDHPLAQLKNVQTTGWSIMNKTVARRIIDDADIMINTSISDANPTTLLEARAWGLITACTPQSGYYNDPFFDALDLDDLDGSVETVRNLIFNVPSEELLERAEKSKDEIVAKYTWDRFCQTIWDEIKTYN